MRPAVKIPVTLFGTLLASVVAVFAIVTAAFFSPSLLLNSYSLRAAATLAATSGIYVQWEHAEIKASSQRVWLKAIDLHLHKLCVQAPAYNLSTCLPQVYAAITVDLHPRHPGIVSFGPISLLGQNLSFGPVTKAGDEPSTFDWTRIKRPTWLQAAELKPIHIEWKQLSAQGSGWGVGGSFRLRIAAPAPDPRAPLGPHSAEVSLSLAPFCLREGPITVDGCIGEGQFDVRIAVINDIYTLTQIGPLDIKSKALSFTLPEAASARQNSSVLPESRTEAATSWQLPLFLQSVRWMPMRVQLDSWQLRQGDLKANGRLDITLDRSEDRFAVGANFGKVCTEAKSAGLHGCFLAVNAELSATLQGSALSLGQVGPLRALGGRMHLTMVDTPAAPATSPDQMNLGLLLDPAAKWLPPWLEHGQLAPVQVAIDHIDILRGGRRISGAFTLTGRSTGVGTVWQAGLSGMGDGKGPLKTAATKLTLRSGNGHFSPPWRMQAHAIAALTDGSEVTVKASTHSPHPRQLEIQVQAASKKAGQEADLKLDGHLGERGAHVRLDGSLVGMIPRIKRLLFNNCLLKLDWQHKWPDQGQLGLACGVLVEPELLPRQKDIPIAWPTKLDFGLRATASLPLPPVSKGLVNGEAHLDLVPLATKEIVASSTTAARLSGTLDDLPRSMQIAVDSATEVQITDFAVLVKSLAASPYAVPAPFNVLSGTVLAQLKATGDLTSSGLDLPLMFSSRLKSGHNSQTDEQRLVTDMTGLLHIAPFGDTPPKLDVNVVLSDVQLALPRITLAGKKAPQLLPDKRMKSTKATRADDAANGVIANKDADTIPPTDAQKLIYHIEVHSPPKNPLHLLSNLAKSPIPVVVDISASSESPPQGHVAVREFPLNLFRRQAFVDKFDLVFTGPETSPTIDGKMRVEYTDYTITILLLGSLKAPDIKLTSEPPRPQNQLIAVLLFGKEMTDLDDDQLRSIDNFGGAAADGALSLASMYLLASTPVQSIGYNPQSRAFTAKINLGKGTSVNIGSDLGDYQKLGVQKRLARNWSVETYIERNIDADTDAVTTLLEWSRRF